jgi:hypothetical protein
MFSSWGFAPAQTCQETIGTVPIAFSCLFKSLEDDQQPDAHPPSS